ncbi:MAG: hypothetical protein N2738_05395 [Thermodesulfovibrionales bacterium]|nr:hypothetical protein [Thermodesulfovibrionales bacterium]
MTYDESPIIKSDISIIEVSNSKSGLNEFINLPFKIYKSDKYFCPRLIRDQRYQFSTKNPFYKHSKIRLYIAQQDKKTLGRIASIVNYSHLSYHNDKTGFFGFFEAYNDVKIAQTLFNEVEGILRHDGLNTIIGPMNFSTNEECGLLIEGFSEHPMIMMPYNPPYYENLISSQGFDKAKDLFAYIYILQDKLPDKVYRVASIAEKRGATVRTISKKTLYKDMKAFQYVYNKAWANNWCFVPINDDELDFTIKELKMIINEEIVAIAFNGNEPVGFLGVIPDVNKILNIMQGKLNPLTLIKALVNFKKINQGRLLLFGIVPEFRNKGIEALLFREVHKGLLKSKIRRIEFSWILEDNTPTIKIAELFGGELYKRYRIFQKQLY